MGLSAFAAFVAAVSAGWELERIRNGILLMMVLFENVQAGNSRSEIHGVLRLPPLRNPLLVFGTLGALGLHVAAMYLPGVSDVLRMRPAGIEEWVFAVAGALVLAGAVDVEKKLRARSARRP
jgi:hypothetical protein